jgi:MFS family permease
MTIYIDLLRRNRDMRMIWLAGLVSLIGDWFSFVVLLALVSKFNPETPGLAVSVLFLARFIPSLIFTPMAGVLLDRFNRRNLLAWSNYTRAVVGVMYLFAVSDPSQQWLIYLGIIIQAVLATVYEPGQAALISNVCEGEDLINANTLINATWSAALAVGGAVGGIVAAAFGIGTALTIDVLTFIVSGALIMAVTGYVHQPNGANGEQHEDTSLAEGLRYIKSQPSTLATMLVKFGGSLGNVDTAMTIFATQIFVMGEDGLISVGLLYTAFGIGAVLGPIITNRLSDGSDASLRRWILVGFITQALGWLILGWAGVILVVCLGLIMRGTGGSVNWTYSSILLQRSTPDVYRGRVFAMDMVFYTIATIFATIVQGGLIDALGEENIGVVAIGTAALSVLPILGWWWAIRRWTRRAEERAAANV